MGNITRPGKVGAGGITGYQAKVLAGFPKIIDQDLDGDYNAIVGQVNGNLENVNIRANAAITYSKLALAGGIVNADVNAAAAIAGTKLAVGSAIRNFVTGTVAVGLIINNAEVVVSTLPVFTAGGGRVILFGKPAMSLTVSAGGAATVTVRLYRNTNGAGLALLASWDFRINGGLGAGEVVGMPMALPEFSEVPTAFTQIYEWRVLVPASGGVFLETPAANPGATYAVELR